MSNDFLTQEEIDALLSKTAYDTVEDFDDEDKDLLGEIGNICMGSAANTLSILLSQSVNITTPMVELTTLVQLKSEFETPNIAIEVEFSRGLNGVNLLVLKLTDAEIIADLMMGGQGIALGGELSEIQISAVSEAMNQMIGTAATSMATMFKREVSISPPDVLFWNNESGKLSNMITENESIVQISFRMIVGTILDSKIMQLLPIQTAKEIIDAMTSGFKEPAQKQNVPVPKEPALQTESVRYEEEISYQPVREQPREFASERVQEAYKETPIEEVPVHKVQFTSFEKEVMEVRPKNIDLILDVPIEVSVILGRTKKTIKEVLEINTGSLIELDKYVEEPVEILVNGKIVAHGEVVVVNENFGVRITSIISNTERVKGLHSK